MKTTSWTVALLSSLCYGWRDMPRSTKEERQARFLARFADVCSWGTVPICTDMNTEGVCQTELGEDAPKKFNRGFRQGLFARAEYDGDSSIYYKNPENANQLCCKRGKLWRTIKAYKKTVFQGIDRATKKECRKLYEANESVIGHMQRKRNFVGFCSMMREAPDLQTLLGLGVDLVCPYVIDAHEFDSDDQIVAFYSKYQRPKLSKEEKAARRAAREARKAERQARREARRAAKESPDEGPALPEGEDQYLYF